MPRCRSDQDSRKRENLRTAARRNLRVSNIILDTPSPSSLLSHRLCCVRLRCCASRSSLPQPSNWRLRIIPPTPLSPAFSPYLDIAHPTSTYFLTCPFLHLHCTCWFRKTSLKRPPIAPVIAPTVLLLVHRLKPSDSPRLCRQNESAQPQ